jgi:hypothetical protein
MEVGNVYVNYTSPTKVRKSLTRNSKTYYPKVSGNKSRPNEFRNALFSINPLFNAESFPSAPDGVYTWIDSDKGFFAIRVKNSFEFGTLHRDLAYRVQASMIFNAGECLKTGTSIQFNTMSGTYTKQIVDEGISTNEEVRAKAKEMFEHMGFSSVEDTGDSISTYITNNYVPMKLKNLKELQSLGYNVSIYENPRNVDSLAYSRLKARRNILQNQKNSQTRRGRNTAAVNANIANINRQMSEFGSSKVNFSGWAE